jgi:hypothetical protein
MATAIDISRRSEDHTESVLLAAAMKFFTAGELTPLRDATPKTTAGGAG